MLHSLASYNPQAVRLYKWTYALSELEDLYLAKMKELVQLKSADYKFLIELASAALGGKSKKGDGQYELDDGEGLDEMTPEQEAELRQALGDDFDKLYGGTTN